ncbi:hypothetical protein BDV96DRAFT_643487 [Lophiotrema nucula]|uniref:Uncharacterized protein n=1 Tax=Lophiotrema nucula TaxID=690887 RepID=A0A6A5ZH53_9PLEO|nr:hypothetical protein BDV96DRAFT_643487 [Lophiotrema nucula]
MSDPNPDPKATFVGCNGAAEKDSLEYLLEQPDFKWKDMPQSTLGNPIHPIFQFSRWRNDNEFTEDLYNKLAPALQLASLFLTDDRVNSWRLEKLSEVVTWTFSALQNDEDNAATVPFPEREAYVRYYDQKNLPQHKILDYFRSSSDIECLQSERYDLYTKIDDRWKSTGRGATSPCFMVSRRYLTYLMNTPAEKPVSPGFLFLLAVTLCHEIAHCASAYPRPEFEWPIENFPKQWHKDIASCLLAARIPKFPIELGDGWEMFMFRESLRDMGFSPGSLGPKHDINDFSLIGYRNYGPEGVSFVKYDNNLYGLCQTHARYETTLISLRSISQFFEQKTWDNNRKIDILGDSAKTWTVYIETASDKDLASKSVNPFESRCSKAR